MRRSSATSSETFRSMLLLIAVLAITLGVAGWFIHSRADAALGAQLRDRILVGYGVLEDTYARGGEQSLQRLIDWVDATKGKSAFDFGVFAADGRHVGGRINTLPVKSGWSEISPSGPQSNLGSLLAFSGPVGAYTVVVAIGDGGIGETGDTLWEAIAIAGFFIATVAILAGYLFGRHSSVKLQRLAEALERVADGNSESRLPESGSNDQIDFVSHQINGYLDKLSELMAGMRNTAIAIAHDLKTPLNRVSMLAQSAMQAESLDECLERLEDISAELDLLTGIVDTVLRISRIEASDDRSTFQFFDLTSAVQDMVNTFEPVFEEHNQTIRFVALPGDIGPAFGDRRMLLQLLVNLIENAGRYAGDGATVEVAVSAGAGAPVVTVSDDGPGIPAERRDKVFYPFFRLDPQRDERGVGLGLAMVKAIATRHRAILTLDDNAPGLIVRLALTPPNSSETASV